MFQIIKIVKENEEPHNTFPVKYFGYTIDVPMDIRWIATDADGKVYGYQHQPIKDYDFWINLGLEEISGYYFKIDFVGNWEDSLLYIGDQL